MTAEITSSSNDRIKWLVRLRDRRHRDEEGVFIVEGRRLYQRALAAGLSPSVTFVVEAGDRLSGEVVTVAPEVLDRASYRSRSEGLIAVFDQFATDLERIEPAPPALLLIAEGVEKPGNLGAMMRTAAAAGVDAVIAVGGKVDPFNPNALRSSTGALFTVPVAMSSWDETLPWLEKHEIGLIGTSSKDGATMWSADLTGPVALVVGAEDEGMSPRAISLAERLVTIPQDGLGVDSLNVSVSAAVLLFEAVRQRQEHGSR